MSVSLRRACVARDVGTFRTAYELASGGLAAYAWAQMAEISGESVDTVGDRRIRTQIENPNRLLLVAEADGVAAGALITYPIGGTPEPVDGEPAVFRPLTELENAALNTLYINVIAVFEPFRHQGIATRLLEAAAEDAGDRPLSLIVSDANTGARAAYSAFGFEIAATRRMIKETWNGAGENWILMIRTP